MVEWKRYMLVEWMVGQCSSKAKVEEELTCDISDEDDESEVH